MGYKGKKKNTRKPSRGQKRAKKASDYAYYFRNEGGNVGEGETTIGKAGKKRKREAALEKMLVKPAAQAGGKRKR